MDYKRIAESIGSAIERRPTDICEDLIAIGYTRLVAIIPESDAIRVVLGKE